MKVVEHAEVCTDGIMEGTREAGFWSKAVCDGYRQSKRGRLPYQTHRAGTVRLPNIRASVNFDSGIVIDLCVAGLNK